MEGTAEAVRREPDDARRLFDHAQNVFQVAELARSRGNTREAEASYREYKRLADRMVAIEPDNLKYRMEGLYARENLGIVLFNQRRYAEAAGMFEGSLRPMESLASLDPNNSEYQRETGKLLNWVAQAQWVLGRLDAAIVVRQRQVAFLERQLKDEGADVLVRDSLIPARRALGLLFTSRGRVERGVEEFRLALAEASRLIGIEPDNSRWRELAAAVRLDLASNLLALERRDEAAQEIRAACATATALRGRDPKVASWQALQTNCLDRRARLALASGAAAQAQALAGQALASARAERSADPVTDRYRVAAQARLLGDVRRRAGDLAGAMAAWSVGLAQLPRNATERPWEMNERAELLKRLDRANEARPVAERLSAIGYHSVT
jgi:tetratricopeptide (TPR) repeat protein